MSIDIYFIGNAKIAVTLLHVIAQKTATASMEFLQVDGYTLLCFILRKHCKEETLLRTISEHLTEFQQCLCNLMIASIRYDDLTIFIVTALNFESKKKEHVHSAFVFVVTLLRFASQHGCDIITPQSNKSLATLPQR